MGRLTRVIRWLAAQRATFIALASASGVLAGVWALFGWPWAAIAGGIPGVLFYLWGEVRSALGGGS